ncbi:MAG TPA: peptidyl-prolyl cis-trans isomerase [Solirubrobacterales bacterium]|nr:peptidyl-prolyl cis-trans isomerase [Solirubrobacterales bacterium]
MSPDQGRKGTTGKGGGGKAPGPAAARRFGLLVFGAAFIVLFVVVAIAEGVGSPSVPSGDAILVQDVPGEVGHVSAADIAHAIEITTAGEGLKKAPKPGEPKYEEAKEAAEKFALEGIWIQGLAAEWGIEVSEQEIAKELKKIKKESFKSEAEFKKFLKESHYTAEDINNRVKIQVLSGKLQEKLKEKAPTPSQSEVKDYYEAAKATQFTQKPSRDVRLVVNKDNKKAEEAKAALTKDNSAKNWKAVAKKYSEDPTTKESGGLQKGLQEGILEEPLNAAVFATPEGQVEGPVKAKRGYTVFEVVNSTPESVQEFKTVESQIQATLAQRLEQEYFTNYLAQFAIDWTGRTFCAPGYVIERCANFKGSGHPSTAPEACFEANPKGGRPEACPAPVFQLTPALPGTVTPLEPKGKPLPQRPHPGGEEKEEAAAGLEGLPEGAVPPTEAPPAEGE